MPDLIKKCWNCDIKLPLEATVCFSCKKKVGPPDKRGIAIKPTNWVNVILTIVGFIATVGYAYWLFVLKE